MAAELLGVGVAPRHHRSVLGDAQVGLPQPHRWRDLVRSADLLIRVNALIELGDPLTHDVSLKNNGCDAEGIGPGYPKTPLVNWRSLESEDKQA